MGYNISVFSVTSLGLPLPFLVAIIFILGAIIGSFLNVVIYRFHTGKSLSGRSHCLSCGKELSWYHLFPLLSYLLLRGRCGYCGAAFTPRYFVVELLTATLFSLVVLSFTDVVEIGLLLLVMALLVLTLVYDLRHMIIPNEFVFWIFVLALLREGYHVMYLALPWQEALGNVLWPLSGAMFFFCLWYFSEGRWIGFGDVKLVVPLGIVVGAAGVFSMIVLSFWIGAVISIILVGLQKLTKGGKPTLRFLGVPLTMKSAVPFAPFLILGCLVVLFAQIDVISFFYNDVLY